MLAHPLPRLGFRSIKEKIRLRGGLGARFEGPKSRAQSLPLNHVLNSESLMGGPNEVLKKGPTCGSSFLAPRMNLRSEVPLNTEAKACLLPYDSRVVLDAKEKGSSSLDGWSLTEKRY